MMLKINDANNFRRSLAGLSLILAPLTFGAADVLRLSVEGGLSGEAQLEAIAANAGLWSVITVLNMIGLILFVPAFLGLMHLLRQRSPVLSHIGGALALIGVLGFVAHNAGYFGVMGALSTAEMSGEQMLAFIEQMESSVSVLMYVMMFLIGFQLGTLLLGIGLYRAQVVPRWIAGLVIVGIVLWIVSSFSAASESVVAIAAVWIIMSAGFAAAGLQLLAMPDSEWERLRATGEQEKVPVGAQMRAP